jgi:hypothetical protein
MNYQVKDKCKPAITGIEIGTLAASALIAHKYHEKKKNRKHNGLKTIGVFIASDTILKIAAEQVLRFSPYGKDCIEPANGNTTLPQ